MWMNLWLICKNPTKHPGELVLPFRYKLQVKFVPELIQQVYLSFGSFEAARERYLLLAGNVVSNTAQEYTPTDFWTKRRTISDRMLFKINHTLWHQGYVEAMQFEIMKVSGPPNWHAMEAKTNLSWIAKDLSGPQKHETQIPYNLVVICFSIRSGGM